ncbi:DUF4249 domain-containing protein [Sabulilitoribacter multivorans]|uniref:DUF4249 domain-containing protein n=1 Tax=Flaviramulus multivorans TaxID=1304750 RepID=A0ABS9IM91_9FLAO|nr:DUF4249 domain-containing protein [Flaviramulus multivorans]MCF7561721.1 DUF4249 domain-containing protein [Flaviramulus multivorans]
MKKIVIILLSLIFVSCEDVIDVDLKTSEPRLVIDASINWIKGTQGEIQLIKLSLTAPYFDETIPAATGASVIVTDSNNNTFNFIEEGSSGVYINDSFIPEIGATYNLTINYNNEIYLASETLIPVVPIEFVEQKNDGGFAGDEVEIKAFYTDPGGIENFYFFEFIKTSTSAQNLEVYDDEFTDGNQIFAFHSDETLEAGDELIIRNSGISQRYYEYLNILLQQTDDQSGDPFQTQPATVRGNCINQTNFSNYPFGYFRASETDVFIYTIQ